MDAPEHRLNNDELITLLQEGNHRYFSEFTNRYEKYIFQKCKSYVKNKDSAEDLCQEVLIKVFLQLPGFRHEARFSTWLFIIIHNTCVDFLRKNKKKVHVVLTEKLADEVSSIVDYDEELPEEKTIEILESLLEELSHEEKLILLLKYKEKHPIRDIQISMGLSESAVKMRLLRAKEKLNKMYAHRLKGPV
ncbi:MAG: RNA polymerase sigma factor [Cyclobacteriaceae bacterium]|nr:RNA polymerase sigma factor [Cyclobacteriaceae bacterium]